MIKPEQIVTITNRSSGSVVYRIPEDHIRRAFNIRETKKVPFSEIIAVAAQNGGPELLYNYFYFEDKNVLEEALHIKPEPEYYLTEDKLPDWIVSSSLEQFQDALDFAPDGIKNLIKKLAVDLPLTDTKKCEALKKQLDFDCLQAIKNEKATKEDDDNIVVTPTTKGRRAKVEDVETPKYTINKK